MTSPVRGAKTGDGTCPACGKVLYRSRAAARNARKLIPGMPARRVYQCGASWHLTSASADEAAKRRDFERPSKTRLRKARRRRAKARQESVTP